MSHTLSTNTGFCNFYTTAVADNTFITNLFIFTTMTFPVFLRSKNFLTEKTILLRL